MAKFEDVLPALRAGKKVRRAGWLQGYDWVRASGDRVLAPLGQKNEERLSNLLANDWEIVPELKHVATYLIKSLRTHTSTTFYWIEQTREIGTQPDGAVLVPGSERMQEDGQ